MVTSRIEQKPSVYSWQSSSTNLTKTGDFRGSEWLIIPNLNQLEKEKSESTLFTNFSKTYAFELGRERELIQRFGDLYWSDFRSQAKFYIDEVYGKVRIKPFRYKVKFNNEGKAELWYKRGEILERAKTSFEIPIHDPALPHWYRKRALRDLLWVTSLEEMLNQASLGTWFVDNSHAPFDVPLEERKKMGFGYQSFTRLYEFQGDPQTNDYYLQCFALRHYLDIDQQVKLFEKLTGVYVDKHALLGSVGRLKSGITIGYVQQLIESLNKEALSSPKNKIPQEELEFKTEEDTEIYFKKMDNWLKGIFLIMKDPEIAEDEIEEQFRGWEMTMKKLIRGEDVNINFLENISPILFLTRSIRKSKDVRNYTDLEYNPGGSDCPGGAGFRKNRQWIVLTRKEGIECVEIRCPRCGWKPKNIYEERLIAEEIMKACPDCGWSPK